MMRYDQFSSVVQLASALSLAGWVAQTPGNPQFRREYDSYDDFPAHYNSYHPYYYGGGWRQQQHGLETMVLPQEPQYPSYPQNAHNLYQSKDAEDSFRSLVELQELISWQEAYRRGDLKLGGGGNQHYNVMPITNNDNMGEMLLSSNLGSSSSSVSFNDDGYGSSGGSGAGSPASSILSNNLDDMSTTSSPPSGTAFHFNELESTDLPGAVGYSTLSVATTVDSEFDIDALLNIDLSDFKDGSSESFEDVKNPFSSLKKLDEDLEYVNSPLKSPSFDEFLASPNPGSYNPGNHALDNSFDDPFRMQFTNSSIPDNKFISDTLLGLGDFDPSVFDNALASDEEIGKALIESLSSKNNKYTASEVSGYLPAEHSPLHKNSQHVLEHDYQKQIKQEPIHEDVVSQKTAHAFNEFLEANQRQTGAIPRGNYQRTFAPPNTRSATTKTKTKQQQQKNTFVWSDFPYTSDELVTMPVETFNEVIATLSEIQQHVAKDIRRKGKNKLAARDCRKRKMDLIQSLDAGVGSLEYQRIKLLEERQKLIEETQQLQKGTEWLNNYIFEHLRDANGIPYSTSQYSLQYTSDGNVYLVPSGQKSRRRKVKN